MNKKIFIVGCSHESLSTAIVMASLDKDVTLICHEQEVEKVLNHYKFERQMVSLWELYVKEQRIHLLQGILISTQHVLSIPSNQDAVLWLFLDTLSKIERTTLPDYIGSPHHHIIMSGLTPIGQAEAIANALATQWVYYFPLVFMKDGESFSSMLKPDMLLIGEKTKDSYKRSKTLSFFIKNSNQHFLSDIKTVEFARSSIMAMLATRISFMNEMARLADTQKVDILEIQRAMKLDKRIGKDYLSAGWGYGGNTLPTELELLKQKFVKDNIKSNLLTTVTAINEDQKELIFRKFWRHFDGFIENKTVVIWGAGYRNGTGRTTNSAIHPLLKLLWSYHIKTIVYATNTIFELEEMYGENPLLLITDSAYSPLSQADALFIINWSLDTEPDIHLLNQVAIPIFDAKNLLNSQSTNAYQGKYYGIGRRN